MNANILKEFSIRLKIREKLKEKISSSKMFHPKQDYEISEYLKITKKEKYNIIIIFIISILIAYTAIYFDSAPMLSGFLSAIPICLLPFIYCQVIKPFFKRNEINNFREKYKKEKENCVSEFKDSVFFNFIIDDYIRVNNKISLDATDELIKGMSKDELDYVNKLSTDDLFTELIIPIKTTEYFNIADNIYKSKDSLMDDDYIVYLNELTLIRSELSNLKFKSEKENIYLSEIIYFLNDKIKDLKSINKEDIIIDNQIINNFSNQKLHQF